jgi:hypothetical protein
MRTAFKEWAIVVDALAQGDQIVVLRKGGIDEGRGGFQLDHHRFLFFPTLFHQQRESVISPAQERYDAIAPTFLPKDRLRINAWAEVVDWRRVGSMASAERLQGQHIWRDEVIRERFDWGRERSIVALAVRVFRLAAPLDLPMSASYGGCRSWVDLEVDVKLEGSTPALADDAFAARLERFREAMEWAEPEAVRK